MFFPDLVWMTIPAMRPLSKTAASHRADVPSRKSGMAGATRRFPPVYGISRRRVNLARIAR